MKLCSLYILFLFMDCFFKQAIGQSGSNGKLWSITDCFAYAQEHNIQVNTLRLNEQSAQQDLWAAKGLKIPSLSASVSNDFENANNPLGGNGHLVNQLTSSSVYTINSSIVLWNGNNLNYTIRQSQLLVQSAGLSVQETLNTITLLITDAYLNILLPKENLHYIQDLVNTSEARVKQGQQLFEAGSIAKKDLLQLQAQLASDRFLLVQTQNTIRQNVLTLKQILQLPSEVPFDIVVPDSVSIAASLPPLQEVQQVAQQNFPEIKIGRLGVDIAQLSIDKAKAGFKPVFKTNAALGTGYNTVLTHAVDPKAPYFTQAGNNFYQLLGLSLSIPIFSNRSNKANLTKAVIGAREANLNYQNTQLVLSQAIEQSYLNVTNALQSYAAAEWQLQAATESYRIGNEAFKLGGTTIYDLLQQRNQYVQAVQAFTQAKYSAVLEQKIYEFYMGKSITL